MLVQRVRRCDNDLDMAHRTEITTPFPSVLETAKRLGVSKRDAKVLSEAAEHAEKTGEFVIPGVGRVSAFRTPGMKRKWGFQGGVVPAKKAGKTRVSKAAKRAVVPSKTK